MQDISITGTSDGIDVLKETQAATTSGNNNFIILQFF